ncbi:MAG: hypothetical protein A2054_01360 [Deltaproteobacteria bacterium GWA2_55_10]|nr:MAG: hypothetical protein A2054_01360 [Deltaproteobacteria bacterium GWA2_55_10]
MEIDSRSTRGFLFEADSRSTLGLLWEGTEGFANIVTGTQKFVHAAFIPRAVLETQTYKAAQHEFIPRVVAWSGGNKAVHYSGAFKAVAPDISAAKEIHGTMTSRVVMPSTEVKAVRDDRIPRVYHASQPPPKVAHSGEQGKATE